MKKVIKKDKKLKWGKHQKRIAKLAWLVALRAEKSFYEEVDNLEYVMQQITKNKSLIFIYGEDGGLVGIGNEDRSLPLLQAEDLI